MKCFTPVYALALVLAVTSDMFEHVSAANCDAATVCPGTTCTDADNASGAGAKAVTKPESLTCASNKFAYIKSLKIVPDSTTTAAKIALFATTDGSAALTTGTAVTKDATGCDNTYLNFGLTATADVKAVVGCTTENSAACTFKYVAEWACQAADSCAKVSTNCPSCVAETSPIATSGTAAGTKELAKTTPACTNGKFAYLKSLTLGADGTTTADKIAVTFTNGATALTATKTLTTCDGTWADVGKAATLTADVKINVACSDTAAACNFKWVGVWECQAADTTPATTTAAPNTTNTTSTTSPPTTTPTATPAATKSGAAALAGANPVVVWGTALVAAVAGANFAAPL